MFFCSLSALCCSDWVSFIDLSFYSPVLSSFFSILLSDILLFKKSLLLYFSILLFPFGSFFMTSISLLIFLWFFICFKIYCNCLLKRFCNGCLKMLNRKF